MNSALIKPFMVIIHRQSLQCFINYNFELIVEPKNNIYFRLEDVETERDLKIKVLSWLSRPSCKGVSPYYQKKFEQSLMTTLGLLLDGTKWKRYTPI